MGKHFIDPKSSEILSIFKFFITMQIALFYHKQKLIMMTMTNFISP
jgi:hypothetical protein